MEMPRNQFRQRAVDGELQFGLWLGLPDSTAAEIAAAAGFDWLLIDAEHAPFDTRSILAHLQTIAGYGVPALVRPAGHDPVRIKQLLDLGAQTLLVPMVDTPDEALRLARAVRYPPHGVRGVGTALARAARWNGVDGYVAHADDEVCLLVQAESTAALEQVESIARVDGVDGVFFGPADLAASMGRPGQPGHPDVVAAIESGLATVRRCGKAAGVLALTAAATDRYVDAGANFVGVGVDTLSLSTALRELAARCEQQRR